MSAAPAERGLNDRRANTEVSPDDVRRQLCSLLLKGLTDPDSEGMDDDADDSNSNSSSSSNSNNNYTDSISLDDDEMDESLPPSYPSGSTGRKGIQRKVFDFFHEQLHLNGDPYVRLNVLMTQLFEPSRTDYWLHYSSYLLLSLSKENKVKYSEPLFPQQLCTDSTFSPLYLSTRPGAADTASLPLFSMDRTQSTQSRAQYEGGTG